MQSGDAGGLFQNAAALLGLCRNQLADLALAHHGGRARTGGRIGKQQLHVAGAHILAIDLVVRALFALDAAAHFQQVGIIEGGGRGAVRIVEHQRHFGGVARGAIAGAREDDVVHAGRAHVLVGVLTHDPAEGFHEIRLAAPIRTHNAGQPGLNHEFGLLAEALETDDAQPVEFHGRSILNLNTSRGDHHGPGFPDL